LYKGSVASKGNVYLVLSFVFNTVLVSDLFYRDRQVYYCIINVKPLRVYGNIFNNECIPCISFS